MGILRLILNGERRGRHVWGMAAGLAMTFGMASAASAAVVPPPDDTVVATQTAILGPQNGNWTGPYLPNTDWWMPKSVNPSPGGTTPYKYGGVGIIKFDFSSISIPQGKTVGDATVVVHIKANSAAGGPNAYLDLYQITSQAVDWDLSDDPYTLDWDRVGKYYGDKVGGTPEFALPTSGPDLEITIPISAGLVQGWLDGSIANRGLELWFRPSGDDKDKTSYSGNLNLRGATASHVSSGIAPKLEIHYVPEPASGSLLLLVGLVMLGGRGIGSTRRVQ